MKRGIFAANLVFVFCFACAVHAAPSSFAQTHDGPPGCGDFLEEAGARPLHLEFVGCEAGYESQCRVLRAFYRVSGARAAEVEDYLVSATGMARLRRNCCNWENWPEAQGRQRNGRLAHLLHPGGPANLDLSVSMGSGETLEGRTREAWTEIAWFHVTVARYLELDCP
ncbi:MAG: DUF4952 domain-containing protein [Desulfovibrio sp.]|jgi:hypothetical protein|nr:DUF4952 domain-containing protein [Desulfovibrio sp.]